MIDLPMQRVIIINLDMMDWKWPEMYGQVNNGPWLQRNERLLPDKQDWVTLIHWLLTLITQHRTSNVKADLDHNETR